MYRIVGTLKSGATVTLAESDDITELEKILAETAVEMMDPTATKYVLEHGHHITNIKDLAAAHIIEVGKEWLEM